MCTLVVRPGDTLVLPVHPPSHLSVAQREAIKQMAEAEFPGVNVVVLEGFAGGPFVYRPDPGHGDGGETTP